MRKKLHFLKWVIFFFKKRKNVHTEHMGAFLHTLEIKPKCKQFVQKGEFTFVELDRN